MYTPINFFENEYNNHYFLYISFLIIYFQYSCIFVFNFYNQKYNTQINILKHFDDFVRQNISCIKRHRLITTTYSASDAACDMSTLSTTRYRSSASLQIEGVNITAVVKMPIADSRMRGIRNISSQTLPQDGRTGETKGAPEKSICLLDGEVAESRQTRLVKVSSVRVYRPFGC